MITTLLILCVLIDVACLYILQDIRRVKRETRDLLKVIREWVDHGKDIRADTQQQAQRVERKVEQLTIVAQEVPEKTAEKVAEKIVGHSGSGSGSASESDKLPTIKSPP